jgi:hypothetical protein
MNGGIHVKQKLPKLKISQQSRFLGKFFWVMFWCHSKGDVTFPCHNAAQCNGKPM